MSYTLKKLKQSEIDHGHQKPAGKLNTKPSYGIFIVCFVVILSIFFVLLDQEKETASHQQISSSKSIVDSLGKMPASNAGQKKSMRENHAFSSDIIAKKPIFSGDKKPKTRASNAIISTSKKTAVPSIHVEPHQIVHVKKERLLEPNVYRSNIGAKKPTLSSEKQLKTKVYDVPVSTAEKTAIPSKQIASNQIAPIENTIRVKNESDQQKIQVASNYIKNDANSNQSTWIETIQYKNGTELDNENNTFQNNQPVLWQNLSLGFQNSMPKMQLNGIVHLENEKDRYVFINMTKYEVDDVVLETGPTIVEIQQHAVIMFYNDKEFIFSVNQ